ncbi:hypothetical protein CBR_g46198 [Chara braunii]|uniref:Oxidoreductase FAD/NAD(P)-binding domain-containing protein n=1 Tax=Chara braunii TaxID=69332 RepID=A0A388M004_CHABU|nr:hypothetical protein CBR_g46198 [Chara braunii]|eukprot:GBG87898.1 hypothetical protein CBR_g46198 [Chara braunii]
MVSLVFANVSESDILLRKELDCLSFSHPNVKVYYVIDKPAKGWDGGVGYINEDMLRKAMPPPSDDNLIMVCGPPGMMRHISGDKAPDKSQGELSGLLAKMGYTKNQVFKCSDNDRTFYSGEHGLPKSAVVALSSARTATGSNLLAALPNYCRRLSVMASHVSGDGDGGKTMVVGVEAAATGIVFAVPPDLSQVFNFYYYFIFFWEGERGGVSQEDGDMARRGDYGEEEEDVDEEDDEESSRWGEEKRWTEGKEEGQEEKDEWEEEETWMARKGRTRGREGGEEAWKMRKYVDEEETRRVQKGRRRTNRRRTSWRIRKGEWRRRHGG